MKKTLALILTVVVLVAGILAGCGKSSTAAEKTEAGQKSSEGASNSTTSEEPKTEPQQTVKVKYVVPGNAPKDYEAVAAEINKKLAADGTGIELERSYIPWDAWEQKINLMLSTGEEFDLFHIMQDWIPFSQYHARGGLADITEAIKKEGSSLQKVIPEDIWEGAKINGKTYVIPAFWVELASEGDFTIRKDLLRKYGLEMPKNPDELLNALAEVMKKWEGKDKPYIPLRGGDCDPLAYHTTMLHRTYDTYPFTVKEKLFYVNQNGDIKSWIETPEFKKDSEFFRKAYKMGLINPDVLTFKQEQLTAQLDNGNWLFLMGTYGNVIALQKANPDFKPEDLEVLYFNPEKQNMRPWGIKNANAVPSTSKNPEAAVKFLNWLYADQSNYDLFMYGIEGKHFKNVGEHKKESLLDENGQTLYSHADWMTGNINLIRVDVNTAPAQVKALWTIDETAVNSIAANFFFDATNVKAEYANVKTELAASIVPIYWGIQEYGKAFPAALDKMKKAGLDKVVEEYKKQFNEWRAKGGK